MSWNSLSTAVLLVLVASVAGSCAKSVGIGEFVTAAASASQTPEPESPNWHSAELLGIKMGETTEAQLVSRLGEPDARADLTSIGSPDDLLYHYKRLNGSLGHTIFSVSKKNRIVYAAEARPESMTRVKVFEVFGNGLRTKRYDFDPCGEANFDSSSLVESERGDTTFLEDRKRGIAIFFVENEDEVQYILYVSQPIGAKVSRCNS